MNIITHIDKTSKSDIDLIISNTNIADKIDTFVNEDTWGSDHFPIFIQIHIEKSLYIQNSHKIRSKRTD